MLNYTLGPRSFLREEPRSAVSEARSGEERKHSQDLTLPPDWRNLTGVSLSVAC